MQRICSPHEDSLGVKFPKILLGVFFFLENNESLLQQIFHELKAKKSLHSPLVGKCSDKAYSARGWCDSTSKSPFAWKLTFQQFQQLQRDSNLAMRGKGKEVFDQSSQVHASPNKMGPLRSWNITLVTLARSSRPCASSDRLFCKPKKFFTEISKG